MTVRNSFVSRVKPSASRVTHWGHWGQFATAVGLLANVVIAAGIVLAYQQLRLTDEQLKLSQNQSQTIFDQDILVNANFTDTGGIPTNFYPGPLAKWTIDASQFKFVRIMYVLNFTSSCGGTCIADDMTARVWGQHITLDTNFRLTHGANPFFSNYTITVSENTYFTRVSIDCDTRNGPQVFCDWKGTIRAHLFIGTFSTRL